MKRKLKPEKLTFKSCVMRYDIQCKDGTTYKEVKVSFVTDDGYFAAVYPPDLTYADRKKLFGATLFESLEGEKQEIAGAILKCTENAVYGVIKKTFINRSIGDCKLDISVFPTKKAVNSSATLWWYLWKASKTIRIDHGEFSKNESGECFFTTDNHNWKEFVGSIVMYQGLEAVGITTAVEKEKTYVFKCLPLDIAAKELCELINERNEEIAKGLIREEQNPVFIIHGDVLEQYEGSDKIVAVPNGVKTIGSRAFEFNNTTAEIVLPQSVEVIDNSAFRHCIALETINLPESIQRIGRSAFYGCKKLKEIVIPVNIEVLEDSVFAYCEKLKKVILPECLVEIGKDAFQGCSKLTQIKIPETVKIVGDYAFASCEKLEDINIPIGATVGMLAFRETKWLERYYKQHDALIINRRLICAKKELKKYSIPDGVVEIGGLAFCCNEATQIDIPSSVRLIGKYAFADSKVEKMIIPEGVTELQECAFYDCSKLKKIIIPKTVSHIASHALAKIPKAVVTILNPDEDAKIYECSFVNHDVKIVEVKEIRAPYGSKTMRCAMQANVPFAALEGTPCKYTYIDEKFCCNGSTLVKYLGHNEIATVPEGIQTIGDSAFYCTLKKTVKKVILPSSVMKIENAAFMLCDELEEICGKNVETIESYAFASCTKLKTANFPKIKSVGYRAFDRCEKLEQTVLLELQENDFK